MLPGVPAQDRLRPGGMPSPICAGAMLQSCRSTAKESFARLSRETDHTAKRTDIVLVSPWVSQISFGRRYAEDSSLGACWS